MYYTKLIVNAFNLTKNRGEFAFIIASIISAGLNYFAYPIITRILNPDQVINTVNTLTVISIIGGVFASSTIIGLRIQATQKIENKLNYLSHSQAYMLWQTAVSLSILAIASPLIASFLKLGSVSSMIVSLFVIYTGSILSIWVGYFNGAKYFRYSSILVILNSLLQLLLLYLLTVFFKSQLSPIIGFLFGTIISLFIVYMISKKRLRLSLPKVHRGSNFITLNRYSTLCLLSFALLWTGQAFDIVTARVLLSDYGWGQFTLASLYPRIVYFLGFTVVWVILSGMLDRSGIRQEKFLYKSLLALLGIVLCASIVIVFLRSYLDIALTAYPILFGGSAFIMILLFKSLYVVMSLLVCVIMLFGHPRFTIITGLFTVLTLLVIVLVASSMVEAMAYGTAIALLGIMVYLVKLKDVMNEQTPS